MRAASREFQHLFESGALGGLADGPLLDRFLAGGDHTAFQVLVARHGPMVWGVCRRLLPDHHDAEDAFQATFLVLARRASSVFPRESVAGWLYGVARRTAKKARATSARRRARQRPLPDDVALAAADDGRLRDLLAGLDHEIGRLPERYRVPIVLCELEGLTRGEAAAQLGWPEGTVASRLARGRALLAERFKRYEAAVPRALAVQMFAQARSFGRELPRTLIETVSRAAPAVSTPAVAINGLSALAQRVSVGMALRKGFIATALLVLGVAGAGVAYVSGASARSSEEPKAAVAPPVDDGTGVKELRRETRSVLDRARDTVRSVQDLEQRVWLLEAVARAQERAGLADSLNETLKALVAAAQETESEHRIVDAAEALARRGDFAAALRLVDPLALNRDYGLDHVVGAMAQFGDFGAATETARTIRSEPYKSEAIENIAIRQAERGDSQGALATAATIGDGPRFALTLTAIAIRQYRAHDPAAADTLERARRTSDKAPLPCVRAELTGLLARSGAVEDAAAVAAAIHDPVWRDNAWTSILGVQLEAGQIAAALRTAERIENAGPKADALKEIVTAYVGANDLGSARALTGRIGPGAAHVEALIAIARGQYRSGLRQDALQTVDVALGEADTLQDGGQTGNVKPAALSRIATMEAEVGEQHAALAWIEKQPEALVRAWSLIGLGKGLAERLPALPPAVARARQARAPEEDAAPGRGKSPTSGALATPVASRPLDSFRGRLVLFGTQHVGDLMTVRIEAINPDGTGLQSVLALDEGQSVVAGRVAPDGKSLAYSTSRARGESAELWLLDVAGTRRKLADDLIVAAWSPDGTRLAAWRSKPGQRRWESVILEIGTGRQQRLPIPATDVVEDWSPDGEALIVMAGNEDQVFEHPTKGRYPLRQIYLVKPDGTGRQLLTRRALSDSLDARFSPDGKRVVYFQRRHPDSQVLHFAVMQGRDASGTRDLASFNEVYAGNKEYRPTGPPCWSPNGRSVVWFVPRRKVPSSTKRIELLTLDVDTGRATRLDLYARGLQWVQAIDWR